MQPGRSSSDAAVSPLGRQECEKYPSKVFCCLQSPLQALVVRSVAVATLCSDAAGQNTLNLPVHSEDGPSSCMAESVMLS